MAVGAGAADARDRGGLGDREHLRLQGRELNTVAGSRELVRLQARVNQTRGRPVVIWWQARRNAVAGLWRVVVVKRTALATLIMAMLHVATPPMPVLTVPGTLRTASAVTPASQ